MPGEAGACPPGAPSSRQRRLPSRLRSLLQASLHPRPAPPRPHFNFHSSHRHSSTVNQQQKGEPLSTSPQSHPSSLPTHPPTPGIATHRIAPHHSLTHLPPPAPPAPGHHPLSGSRPQPHGRTRAAPARQARRHRCRPPLPPRPRLGHAAGCPAGWARRGRGRTLACQVPASTRGGRWQNSELPSGEGREPHAVLLASGAQRACLFTPRRSTAGAAPPVPAAV